MTPVVQTNEHLERAITAFYEGKSVAVVSCFCGTKRAVGYQESPPRQALRERIASLLDGRSRPIFGPEWAALEAYWQVTPRMTDEEWRQSPERKARMEANLRAWNEKAARVVELRRAR